MKHKPRYSYDLPRKKEWKEAEAPNADRDYDKDLYKGVAAANNPHYGLLPVKWKTTEPTTIEHPDFMKELPVLQILKALNEEREKFMGQNVGPYPIHRRTDMSEHNDIPLLGKATITIGGSVKYDRTTKEDNMTALFDWMKSAFPSDNGGAIRMSFQENIIDVLQEVHTAIRDKKYDIVRSNLDVDPDHIKAYDALLAYLDRSIEYALERRKEHGYP